MYDYKILIIDDNEAVLKSLKLVLTGVFRTIVTVQNPQLIPALIAAGDVDAVLLDMNFDSKRLDGEEGLFWLKRIKSGRSVPAVVLITAFGDVDLAVHSLKIGADDFVTKPWDNDSLIQKLVEAVANNQAKLALKDLGQQAEALHRQVHIEHAMTLEELERQRIMDVLAELNGNLTSAAQRLGINRQTLYNKIKKFGLQ